jgi:hypothetical protein
MYGTKPGYLRVTQPRVKTGRIIDEWDFVSPLGHKGPKLSVTVSLRGEGAGIKFVAHGAGLVQELADTDIERLRQAVEKELQFQHDAQTNLVWEDWLEVVVSSSDFGLDRGLTASLKLSVNPLKRAIDPVTGKPLQLNSNNLATPFPEPKAAGEKDVLEEDPRFSNRQQDFSYSYIPATEVNIEALKDIQRRIAELRQVLADFLSPDRVQQSLLNLSMSQSLLPDITKNMD